MMKKIFVVLSTMLSFIYILNPTFGVFEFIPDALPYFGNLDEATATAILIWGLKTLFKKEHNQVPDEFPKEKNH